MRGNHDSLTWKECVFKVLHLNNRTVYKLQLPSALNLDVNDWLGSRVSPVRHLSLRRLGGSLTAWFLSAPVEQRPLCFSHYCPFLINVHPPPPMSIFLTLQFRVSQRRRNDQLPAPRRELWNDTLTS